MAKITAALALLMLAIGCGSSPSHGGDGDGGPGGDSGGGPCSDTCSDGALRCADLTTAQQCTRGTNGCLDWVTTACGTGEFCGSDDQCQPDIPCRGSCPDGYRCSPQGQCAGGAPDALTLEVTAVTASVVKVSGSVTLNGAVPDAKAFCAANPTAAKATISFVPDGGSIAIPCSQSSFEFSGTVDRGHYSSVYVSLSALPLKFGTAVRSGLDLTAEVTGLALDVKTYTFAGAITLNGKVPTELAACTSAPDATVATVTLTDRGDTIELPIACKTKTFAFSGMVYPGTYEVSVSADATHSNLPAMTTTVLPALTVSGNISGQAIDIKTAVVSGTITLSGATPTTGPECATNPTATKALVILDAHTPGAIYSVLVPCSATDYAWSATVAPGTYDVSISGDGPTRSNLPTTTMVALRGLVVSGAASGIVLPITPLTVSGTVTLDGKTPIDGPDCFDPKVSKAAVFLFDSVTQRSMIFGVPCGSASYAWSGVAYPGSFRVTLVGSGPTFSNIPSLAQVQIEPALMVTGNLDNHVVAGRTAHLSGTITIDGKPPVVTACTDVKATVSLAVPRRPDVAFRFPVPCSAADFSWSGVVWPTTQSYTLSVAGSSTGKTGLPSQPFVANAAFPVTGDLPAIAIDVRTTPVAGHITDGGAVPATGAGCSAAPTATKAWVDFLGTQGTEYSFAIPCSSTDYAWQGTIYDGTYEISVRGVAPYSSLPANGVVTTPRIALP